MEVTGLGRVQGAYQTPRILENQAMEAPRPHEMPDDRFGASVRVNRDRVEISGGPVPEEETRESFSRKGSVGINAGKLARLLAAAKTRSQVRAVIAQIQADLQECESGREQCMEVDEASVEAA